MNRRHFLLGTIAGGAVLTSSGAAWLGSSSNDNPLTINACLQVLDDLMSESIVTTGEWNLGQILIHCAQSVEYSMSGFPEHKSDLFKSTAGKLGFTAFSAKGEMSHGLSEGIPGAPSIAKNENTIDAYTRFRESMIRFRDHNGPLAQHFAYGQLTKPEYERAHAMHFYNHCLEIKSAKPNITTS